MRGSANSAQLRPGGPAAVQCHDVCINIAVMDDCMGRPEMVACRLQQSGASSRPGTRHSCSVHYKQGCRGGQSQSQFGRSGRADELVCAHQVGRRQSRPSTACDARMHVWSPVLLLLLLAAAGRPAAQSPGLAQWRRATDLLTEQVFQVVGVVSQLSRHARRLDAWQDHALELEQRLQSLESGVSARLTGVEAALAGCVESQAAAARQLAQEAAAHALETQTRLAAQQSAADDRLSTDVSALGGQVAGLSDSLARAAAARQSAANRTRQECHDGVRQLAEPLHELLASDAARQRDAATAEEQLRGRLQSLHDRLQLTDTQLGNISEQLQLQGEQLQRQGEQLQASLTTTTPTPTVDPYRRFINQLNIGLRTRENAISRPAA